MRPLRTASLLVAFYLLTSAATAYAECAWVLWSGNTTPWGAYETKKECEGARNVHRALAQLDARKYPSLQVQEPSLGMSPRHKDQRDSRLPQHPRTRGAPEPRRPPQGSR